MSDFSMLASLVGQDAGRRFYGVVVGIVTNNKDPDGLGRVKVAFPWLSDDSESFWARVATPMAGKNRGLYLLPEVDDEVLVAFEHGSLRDPIVLGALWNGVDRPPESNANGRNDHRTLKSRSGHVIRLDDTAGSERVDIVDKSGRNRISIRTVGSRIVIDAGADVVVTAHGGTVKAAGQNVKIEAKANISMAAQGTISIEASGQLTLKGATVDIN